MNHTIDSPTWHPSPSRPAYQPPPGAVDAHCHVFGPGNLFPYAPTRKYTPSDAPRSMLFALREYLGFSRNVIVQASCHGRDNRALVDALQADPDHCRGVAVVDPMTSDTELDQLHEAGVRGIRLNFVKRLVDPEPFDISWKLVQRIQSLGWHTVVYFEASDLQSLRPQLESLPGKLVIDHMGRPDVSRGVESAGFADFIAMLDANPDFHVKVGCPERLTVAGAPYDDVVPFARRLVERFPDRVLWGTDWPHPNMKSHQPDDGVLVDRIPMIAVTETLRQKLLVDNCERLYWS